MGNKSILRKKVKILIRFCRFRNAAIGLGSNRSRIKIHLVLRNEMHLLQ